MIWYTVNKAIASQCLGSVHGPENRSDRRVTIHTIQLLAVRLPTNRKADVGTRYRGIRERVLIHLTGMVCLRGNFRNALILGILFAGGLFLVWRLRHVLLLIYTSIIFAVIFMPAVRKTQQIRVRNWRPGRGTAVVVLLIAVLLIVSLVGMFMLPPIVQDISDMAHDLPAEVQQFAKRVETLPFGAKIESSIGSAHLNTGIRELLGKTMAVAQGLFSVLMSVLLVILMAAYFVANGPETSRWGMSFVPHAHQPRLREALLRGADRAQQWLTGQALLMLILGSSSTIVFAFLHVRYFYALGLFAGLANFIPVVGPIATVVVAGVVAALDSWMKVLGVVIFYVIYQQVENAYLSPTIMKAKVGLPGIAVIVALAIGGALAGITGALVSVPTAAIIATLLNEYVTDEANSPDLTQG